MTSQCRSEYTRFALVIPQQLALPAPAPLALLPAPAPVALLPARTATGETERLVRRLRELIEPSHVVYNVERHAWGSQVVIGARYMPHVVTTTATGVAIKDPLYRTPDVYVTRLSFPDLVTLIHSIRSQINQDEQQRLQEDLLAEFTKAKRQRLLAVHKSTGVTEIRIGPPLQVPWVIQVNSAYVTFQEYVPLYEQHHRSPRWSKQYAIRCPRLTDLQPFLDAVVAEHNTQQQVVEPVVVHTTRYSIPVLSDRVPPPAPEGFVCRPAGMWPGTNYRIWVYERADAATAS